MKSAVLLFVAVVCVAASLVPPSIKRIEVQTKGAYKAFRVLKNPYSLPPNFPNTLRTNFFVDYDVSSTDTNFDYEFNIQTSTDLVNWQSFLTVTNTNCFCLPIFTSQPRQFFRAEFVNSWPKTSNE